MGYGDPGGAVMASLAAGNAVQESTPPPATADAPYYPGPLAPVNAMGDADAGGRDDVAGTPAAAVAAAGARYMEHASDTLAQGSVIGDIMTLPPSPLDPGVGSTGTTDPAGHFYDPPRDY